MTRWLQSKRYLDFVKEKPLLLAVFYNNFSKAVRKGIVAI